jgi:hypothetical protein
MLSNPCTWFAGGGNYDSQKSFTYQTIERPDFSNGATKEELEEQVLKEAQCPKYLWHFSPRTNGLSTCMEDNIVWFADDVKQAMKILRDMIEFRIQCAKKQSKYYQKDRHQAHAEEFDYREKGTIERCLKYLKAMDEGKLIITIAPVNQFYEVGWASNDNILH